MASMISVLAPLGKAVRAFFKSDVRLRRDDSGLHVVFENQAPAPAKRGKKKKHLDAAAEREAREFERMTASLTALLDHGPDNRSVLRHLVFIEGALQKKGGRALYKVPYEVLRHALTQFEGVVTNWSDEGLACLRSKMAVALIEREQDARDDPDLNSSVMALEVTTLEHPEEIEAADVEDAQAALLAAYGAAAVSGVAPAAASPSQPAEPISGFVPIDDGAGVQVQGELQSPSARALARAAKAGASREKVDLHLRELQP
jgi:hypothetical protein